MLKSASEILAKAADLIGERGWCQGKLIEQDGSLCTMGAIQLAMGFEETEVEYPGFNSMSFGNFGSPYAHAFYKKELMPPRDADIYHEQYNRMIKQCEARLLDVINRRHPHDYTASVTHIPEWNDRSGTTKEDVVLALKEACAESLSETPERGYVAPPTYAMELESLFIKDIKFNFFANA